VKTGLSMDSHSAWHALQDSRPCQNHLDVQIFDVLLRHHPLSKYCRPTTRKRPQYHKLQTLTQCYTETQKIRRPPTKTRTANRPPLKNPRLGIRSRYSPLARTRTFSILKPRSTPLKPLFPIPRLRNPIAKKLRKLR
jgi:hypothetical protein